MALRTRRLSILILCLAAGCSLATAAGTRAAPRAGSLDRSFAQDGILTADFGTEPTTGHVFGVVVQPGGKVVVLQPGRIGAAVARYRLDGSLDPSFGEGGVAVSRFTDFYLDGSISLGPQGAIVVSSVEGMTRFTPDGQVDRGFAADGQIYRSTTRHRTSLETSVTQADGSTLVVSPNYSPRGAVEALRFAPDGSLDRGYGQNGRAFVRTPNGYDYPIHAATTPDGGLVFVTTGATEGGDLLVLGRFDPSGQVDRGFGADGLSVMPAIGGDPVAIALGPDGTFVVATEGNHFARFSTRGALDHGFGNDGVAVGAAPGAEIHAIAATPDNRILAAGSLPAGKGLFAPADFLLEGLTAGGEPDPSIGRGAGFATARPDPRRQSGARGLALLPGGRVLLAGESVAPRGGARTLVTLVAFEPDGSVARSFGKEGVVLTEALAPSADTISGLIVDRRGRTTVTGRAGGALAVARYLRGGQPDRSFGSNGLKRLPDLGGPATATGRSLAPYPGGRLIVAADSIQRGGVFRLRADGGLDRSFGSNGLVGRGAYAAVLDLAVSGDGGILTAGYGGRGGPVLTKLEPSGGLDRRFGRGGEVELTRFNEGSDGFPLAQADDGTIALPAGPGTPREFRPGGQRIKGFGRGVSKPRLRRSSPKQVYDLAFDSAHRLLLAGRRSRTIALSRRLPNGKPDPGFGRNGLVLTPLGASSQLEQVRVEPSGRIVAAGTSFSCDDPDSCPGRAVVLRYEPDGRLDRSFGDNGRFVRAEESVARITSLALRPGTITIGGAAAPARSRDLHFFIARLNR